MRDARSLPWLSTPLSQALQARGHALVLHGAGGAGLLELGWTLARGWLCEGAGARPCGECGSCHLTQQHGHPDLRLVLPEVWQQQLGQGGDGDDGGDAEGGKGKRKPSKDIRVEQIRQAIDWSHTTSGRGQGKVMLLFPADAMNAVSANALLKTLEEPAAGLRLVLCTEDPERLLPTIRSRCQMLRVPLPDAPQSLAWLREQGLADADWLLRACNDQPLAALSAASQGLTAEVWRALPAQLARADGSVLGAMALPDALRTLQQICHDLMAVAVGAEPRYFQRADLPRRVPLTAVSGFSRALMQAVRQQDHPWNAGLLLESLLQQGREALGGTEGRERAAGARAATLRP